MGAIGTGSAFGVGKYAKKPAYPNYYQQQAPSYAPKAPLPTFNGGFDASGYDFLNSAGNKTLGFKGGSKAYDILQGFKDSPLGAALSGGQGGNLLAQLKSDPAYQKLLGGAGGSFGDYYQQAGVSGNYANVEKLLNEFANSKNPSGGTVASAELLAAPGLAGIEQGGRDLRQNLLSAGGAGGNRSGLGDLASILPSLSVAQQGGQVRTQASLGALDQENRRGAANAQLKLGALGELSGIAGNKSQLSTQALQGYTSLNVNAQQAALQALLAVLGLEQQNQPQFNLNEKGNFNVSGPFGSLAA